MTGPTQFTERTTLIRACDHVKSIIDPAGAVLLDLKAGTYFSLNKVGALIWQRIQEGASFCEIVHSVSAACSVPESKVETDLSSFLAKLDDKGMIYADHK